MAKALRPTRSTFIFGLTDSEIKKLTAFLQVSPEAYGRGAGVGRGRGVGAILGVGVGLAVAVGVADADAVAVAVAVGVGLAPPPWKLNLPIRVCQLKLPFVAWYSLMCQKLVPSEGSILFLL